MGSDKVVDLTESNFEEEVLDYKGVVLIDFWATWCGPCVAMSPVIEQIATEFDGKVKVAKLDTQENPALTMKYNVTSIPLLMLVKDGEVVKKEVGAKSLESAKRFVESVL